MVNFKLPGLHNLNLYKVQPFAKKELKAKEKPEKIPSFTEELDSYISKQIEKAEKETEASQNISRTDQLDAYIAKQSQQIYAQRTTEPLSSLISPASTQKINPTEPVRQPFDIREIMAEKMQSIPSTAHKLEEPNLFTGLAFGSEGENVKELQKALNRWMPKLRLKTDGCYDNKTAKAVTLFKAVYNTGTNGENIDYATSKLLLGIKDGSFWRYDSAKSDQYSPPKTIGGEIIHKAANCLGTPYFLGGDGIRSTDCAMLTKTALVESGMADDTFTRLADDQYKMAEQKQGNLTLVDTPKAGDLVFFKNTSWQSYGAYKGITHVGIYVGKDLMLVASPSYGGVTLQNVSDIEPKLIAGYARAAPKSKV